MSASDRLKLTIYLRSDQYIRLKTDTLTRVLDAGGGKPDISERVREILDTFHEAADAVRETSTPKKKKTPPRS